MKFLMGTKQDVDYINRPLSEMIANKGVIIHTNYYRPDILDFQLSDPFLLEFLAEHSSYKNWSVCLCRGAYFRYNARDKSFTELHTSYLVSTPDCGGASDDCTCGGYDIVFTIGERMILKKLTTIMWIKVLSIRIGCTFRKFWDGLHQENG